MVSFPEAIYLEDGAEDFPLAEAVLHRCPETPVYRQADILAVTESMKQSTPDVFGAAKKQLMLTRFKGSFLKKCPGLSPGMVCCNYYVVNLIKNCIYDCSYCFLQDFLENNPLTVAFVNIEDLISELEQVFTAFPERSFRVGTGELTDSLALDHIVPYTDWLIPYFSSKTNAVLELKTKSDRIENLLQHEGPENIIVSWSINPQSVIAREEKGTPSLDRRLAAAQKVHEKGYSIGFHLDPLIIFPGWEEEYAELARRMFEAVPPDSIEWISLGSFRYRPNLKQIIRERHPGTELFTSEHVASKDGKFRYLRPLRNHAYDRLRSLLRRYSRDLNIYMCMETREVWEGVTGQSPREDTSLDWFFQH